MFNEQQKQFFEKNGYVVAEQLFNTEEVEFYLDYYMKLRDHEKVRKDDRFPTATSSEVLCPRCQSSD